ncbi:MAG: oxidoreductase [Spirochaetes bacterium]|nr:MAG: oxidoreductase [Spirochaetota bacterium]RKX93379.1 MAG: oxidoreductase [Spirochaetota bacterium]
MILKALIFSNSFALIIALLLIFMDRVINNYGPCTLTINNDKEVQARGGTTLLRNLFESKYFIPSACGGKGTCGYCKLIVTEGGGSILPTEELMLSSAEKKQGYRLTCQLKVKNNLKLHIPEEYLNIQEYEGKIVISDPVTSDIRRVGIALSTEDEITYKPGQYVQIKIPGSGESDYRAYSMSSCPDEKKQIEINVKLIPDGVGSGYIHSLSVGDELDFSGPYGDFYLREDSHRDIICVAGGVGLAPIKSILLHWQRHNLNRTLWLFYGARSTEDLYDHEIFAELDEREAGLKYFPALSEPDEDWTGKSGFIHSVMDKALPGDVNGEAYLCGPPIMIDAVTEVLVSKGVSDERIWYDKF